MVALAGAKSTRLSGPSLMTLLEPGDQVGAWTVARFIDAGGNGEVWEVHDAAGTPAALKILKDRRVDSVAYRRFRREIETVEELNEHPGVLPLFESHLPEQPSRKDRAWYVMALAEPLTRALEGRPVHDAVEAVAYLAEALSDLHERGIGHRDIKPANLLWHNNEAALGDFGLVSIPGGEALTEPGRVPGAFGYIADEVLLDPEGADAPPADVFALAKVLWKLLTPTALYPPQGSLRADRGSSTLARSLTVAHADTLDGILERATAPVQSRITMAALARELAGWLALPAPAELPEGLDAMLLAARRSMEDAVEEREQAAGVERAVSRLQEVLVTRSAGLIEGVSSLDQAGAQVGPMAVGRSHQLVEQLPEGGQPLYGPPFHHGVRITRPLGPHQEDVLVISWCMQVSDDGQGVVAGMLLAGDETTNNATFRKLATRRADLGVALEAAIEEVVSEAENGLGEVLTAFIERTAPD